MSGPAWRVAASNRTHAYYGFRPLWSVCTRVRFEGTRLPRAGEVVAPCRHCTKRVAEQDALFKMIARAGKKMGGR